MSVAYGTRWIGHTAQPIFAFELKQWVYSLKPEPLPKSLRSVVNYLLVPFPPDSGGTYKKRIAYGEGVVLQ